MKNPTDLPRQVLAFGDRHGMLPAGATVLCALSGGGDSMALLTCLQELAGDRALTVLAAHYNHQLRGAEAQRDEDFVTHWCRRHHIPLTVGRGDVAAQAARTGRGVEETARAMRYAFLEKTAQAVGADAIATAHNADDNAETLLLHLVRGTGLDGLTGIPPKRGNLIRPLLAATRREIQDYLSARSIPYQEDSTNADPAYARNRIRRDVMPVLRDLNPNFSHRLAANLTHIQADRAFLEDLARTALPPRQTEDGWALSAQALTDQPRPVAVRAVKHTLAQLGRYEISAVHLDQILALAAGGHPSARLSLPRGLRVWRDYDSLLFSIDPPDETRSPDLVPVSIPGPGTYPLGPWELEVALCPAEDPQGPYRWFFRPEALAFPLLVRPRTAGDRLRLPGRRSKSLKKWYMEEKIPRQSRDALPVLTDAHGLLAAAGLGPQADRTAPPGAQAIRITLRKTERTGASL